MDGIRQHKEMAMGGDIGGNFGVEPLSKANGGTAHPDGAGPTQRMPHGENSKMLDDSRRAGPPHVGRGAGKMPATAHSDHGPHQMPGGGSFGVASLKSVNG